MSRSIAALGAAHFIAAGVALAPVLLFVLLVVATYAGLLDDSDGTQDRFGVAMGSLMFSLPLVAIALCELPVGWGLIRLRPWGRPLGIAASALHLAACIAFPFTTVLGVAGLIVLLNGRAAETFRRAAAAEEEAAFDAAAEADESDASPDLF